MERPISSSMVEVFLQANGFVALNVVFFFFMCSIAADKG